VVEIRVQRDEDIHLVIEDPHHANVTMVVEFPAARCVPHSAEHRASINRARTTFEQDCGPLPGYKKDLNGRATITGVGFWDVRHNPPIGAAPNFIELHPVLGFRLTSNGC
jgi:hypothetical protein